MVGTGKERGRGDGIFGDQEFPLILRGNWAWAWLGAQGVAPLLEGRTGVAICGSLLG